MMKQATIVSAAVLAVILGSTATAAGKPLKVYILAGQSNMDGHAKITTFDYIGEDPATAPLLKEMRGPDGKPTVCDKVWISYLSGSPDKGTLGERAGKLTAGFGANEEKIGPEFTFGITMQKSVKEPILLIKTAWGGKSLHTDFRSPSAGPYVFNEKQVEGLKKQGKDLEAAKAEKAKATGLYYRLMLEHVSKVLKDIKRVYPDYDAKQGYEIAGFVWFQGWNDMVDGSTYPNRDQPGGYDLYSMLLAHFIRDVRKDLNAPKMPFVIGVMGVDGPIDKNYNPRYKAQHSGFRQAMAAPAALPEFKGNVIAVETALCWDMKLRELANKKEKTPEEQALWKRGTSNLAFHYLGSAKILGLIGKAFAEAMPEAGK